MKKIYVGSSIGVLAIAVVFPAIVLLNIPKFESKLHKDVVAWNERLPSGYQLTLTTDCGFTQCNGEYNLVSSHTEDPTKEVIVNFQTHYNPLHFILPSKPLDISGSVQLSNNVYKGDFLKTQVKYKGDSFATFSGSVFRNGDIDVSLTKNAATITISEEDDDIPLMVIEEGENSKGHFQFKNKSVHANMNIPRVIVKDTEASQIGMLFEDIKVKGIWDIARKDAKDTKDLETSGEINIAHIEDISVDRALNVKNVSTSFSFLEGLKDFTHKTTLKADSFYHASLGEVSYNMNYGITVPLTSKQALVDFISTIQTSDMETRQGAFYEILKNGFNFDLNQLEITEKNNNNSIKANFNLNMAPSVGDKNFVDRTQFKGSLSSTGDLAALAMDMTGFKISEIAEEDSAKAEAKSKKYNLTVKYDKNGVSFNNKPVDKSITDTINASLLSLEHLLKEGEENYKKFKAGDVSALSLEKSNAEDNVTPPEIGVEEESKETR